MDIGKFYIENTRKRGYFNHIFEKYGKFEDTSKEISLSNDDFSGYDDDGGSGEWFNEDVDLDEWYKTAKRQKIDDAIVAKKDVVNDDEDDDVKKKVCLVCGDQAKRNYFGKRICDSCKTFWVGKTRQPEKIGKCINGQLDCIINVSTRSKCNKCRYDRCMSLGLQCIFLYFFFYSKNGQIFK